ncbi:MAG: hypothetical protein WA057_01500 [Candidatus Magasanikiibacteriota bacterium]
MKRLRTFTMPLDYSQVNLIDHLVQKGGPWGWWDKGINSANFAVSGTGIVQVEFCIVPGEELKSADGNVRRDDAEAKFRAMGGMHFPNAAEALLVPANGHQVGRGDHPMLAFVESTSHAFFVSGDERNRRLDLGDDDGYWFSYSGVLAVCEQRLGVMFDRPVSA